MGTSSARTAPSGGAWTKAKTRSSRFAGSSGSPRDVPGVVGSYLAAVSSPGGTAGRAALSGRAIAACAGPARALAGFFSDVATRGLDEALAVRGLGHLVGRSPFEVVAGLVDALVGDGSELSDAIVRAAEVETLSELVSQLGDEYAELQASWDRNLNEEEVRSVLGTFLSNVIFTQWASDMADRLERQAVSEDQLSLREAAIREFIEEHVRFELGRIAALSVDWGGQQGIAAIDGVLQTAIGLMIEEAAE